MTVGQRLKAARIAAKISRNEASKELKCSVHTLKAWELDRHRPSPLMLSRIETLFALEKGHFSCTKSLELDKAISALKGAVARLPERKQHHAIKIIEHFSKFIS